MSGLLDGVKAALVRLRRKKMLLGKPQDLEDETELESLENELADADLSLARRKKVQVLAKILGVSEQRAAREIFIRAISGLPERPLSVFLLPDIALNSCERVSEELIRVELKNGRAFFGQRSNEKEYLLYRAFKPDLPQLVDGDSYKLVLDIQRRYLASSLRWFNSNGGVFVEGGCFTGMKAIRWHDLSPKPVRVLAVEIGKRNSEILAANIRENGLERDILPVHAGLWRETGEGTQKHSFSTRRFLETSDRWQEHLVHEEKVRLLNVRDLLDECEVDVADYFNIQVNGAEIEVLKGAADSLDRVKVFDVAAYYSKDGIRNVDIVRELLTSHGCTILSESEAGRISAVTPKYRDEILALKPKGKRHRA